MTPFFAFLSEKNISVPGRACLIALSASIVQSLRTEYSSYTMDCRPKTNLKPHENQTEKFFLRFKFDLGCRYKLAAQKRAQARKKGLCIYKDPKNLFPDTLYPTCVRVLRGILRIRRRGFFRRDRICFFGCRHNRNRRRIYRI